MPTLDLVSPGEHFKEKISNASKRLNIEVSSDIEFYLVTLMCDFIRPSENLSLDRPLALRLKEAIESRIEDRQRRLKLLGDTSLYLAGFFQDFFNKKTYDIDYYISMGSNAYLALSEESLRLKQTYKDLSNRFSHLVELVALIADSSPLKQDLNLLAIYDRWTRSGSERLRKILEDEGISPIEVNMNKAQ